jgi:hypothetical protein
MNGKSANTRVLQIEKIEKGKVRQTVIATPTLFGRILPINSAEVSGNGNVFFQDSNLFKKGRNIDHQGLKTIPHNLPGLPSPSLLLPFNLMLFFFLFVDTIG